jgi:hypothetical protein
MKNNKAQAEEMTPRAPQIPDKKVRREQKKLQQKLEKKQAKVERRKQKQSGMDVEDE